MNSFQNQFNALSKRSLVTAKSSVEERIEKIKRLYTAAFELRAEITEASMSETASNAAMQLMPLKGEIEYICQHLESWVQPQSAEDHPSLGGRKAYVHYEPKGVVLYLSTWNAAVVGMSPLASMIAAGNTVVFKPSELGEATGKVLGKVIERAGLTEDVFVVHGGPEVAQELLTLPFNHVLYIGSNRVGKLIMQAAAENFASVTLEMGGKNPVIVEAEADIEDAAARLASGKHILGGQACLCPDYVLVEESNQAPLIECLKDKLTTFYNPERKGFEQSADLPRIINARHFSRIQSLIADAVNKGAKVEFGGETNEATRFIAPTILTGVTEDMDIFHEEVFGPVLMVQGFKSREEVLTEIAKRPRPLGIYIFTSDKETADWYMANTRAGSSAINGIALQATCPTLSFGGSNHSGIGRLGGKAGFQEFSNARGVVADAFVPSERAAQFYPPFPTEMGAFLDELLKPAW